MSARPALTKTAAVSRRDVDASDAATRAHQTAACDGCGALALYWPLNAIGQTLEACGACGRCVLLTGRSAAAIEAADRARVAEYRARAKAELERPVVRLCPGVDDDTPCPDAATRPHPASQRCHACGEARRTRQQLAANARKNALSAARRAELAAERVTRVCRAAQVSPETMTCAASLLGQRADVVYCRPCAAARRAASRSAATRRREAANIARGLCADGSPRKPPRVSRRAPKPARPTAIVCIGACGRPCGVTVPVSRFGTVPVRCRPCGTAHDNSDGVRRERQRRLTRRETRLREQERGAQERAA